jgi:Ion transport protein
MSPRIEHAVAGVIAANAGVLVAGLAVDGHERLFDTAHDVIVAFFLLELLTRLATNGWRFFARPFNAFDAAVLLVSALPLAGVDASLLRVARLARRVHFARHAAHLRLARPVRTARLGQVVAGRRRPDHRAVGQLPIAPPPECFDQMMTPDC